MVIGHWWAKKLYLDVAAFYNDYDDLYGTGTGKLLLEASPPKAPSAIREILQVPIANASKGDTAGVEIAPDWKPTDWWELKSSYSYLHLETRNKPGFTDPTHIVAGYNGSSPHHQIQLQSQFNLPKKLELDMTFRYVSALPAQTVNAYGSADLRFGWHLNSNMELSVVGQNLLQPYHTEFGGDANTIVGIKRTVYAKLTWQME